MSATALPNRLEVLREHRARGGKIAAVFPLHYPRALLRAFDLLPVEVWSANGAQSRAADEHLQAYICSLVRAGMSFASSPQAELVDLFLVPHACDSTQGLGSVLLDLAKPSKPVMRLYPPRGEGEPAVAFLERELRRLFEELAAFTGKRPTEAELHAAIAREEAADAALAQLLANRARLPLSNRAFYDLARTREFLPAEAFAEHAHAALATSAGVASGLPALLSGILPEPAGALDALDELGVRVVADDLANTGRRAYLAGKSADPFRRMSESLLSGPPDSTRGSGIEARIAHLTKLARDSGAKIAVFLAVKFCEPEAFYLPALRKALEAMGVRSVIVELQPHEPFAEQARTRIEALVETAA